MTDAELGKALLASFDAIANTSWEYINWDSDPEGDPDPQRARIVDGELSVCLDGDFRFVAIAKDFLARLEAAKHETQSP
jgi:hypothetical protein